MLLRHPIRALIVLSLALALLLAWGLLRGAAPAGGVETTLVWSVSVTPDEPKAGDTIEVTIKPSGADSPFMFQNLVLEQDGFAPVVELVDHEQGYGAKLTLSAIRPGTASLSVTGFFEKYLCPEDPPHDDVPCFPYGFYDASPTITIEVSGPPPLCGDANFNDIVDPIDAAIILQYSAGLVKLFQIDHLNVDASEAVDAIDAAIILQFSAGLLPAPVC